MKDFNRTDLTRLRGCNECILIGKLEYNCEYPIGIMSNSLERNIFFNIKAICPEPSPIVELINKGLITEGKNQNYLGIDSYQWQIMDEDYLCRSPEERIKFIKDKLDNKVVLFTPSINIINSSSDTKVYKNLRIISVEDSFDHSNSLEYESYVTIDNFNSVLEYQILYSKPINICDYNKYMPGLKYILCGKYLYYGFSNWQQDKRSSMLIAVENTYIRKVEISKLEEFKRHSIVAKGNHSFIEKNFVDEIIKKSVSSVIPEVKNTVNNTIYNYNINSNDKLIVNKRASNDECIDCNSEFNFLQELKYYTIKEGLCYDFDDLVNFHVSIKTDPLTILAGMSGMGKTQLALSYAEVLGLNKDIRRTLIVPISPSYTEPSDLLGYLNNATGKYISSQCGLVDFLIKANKNKENMYMVIFEEMNLSQIEHWFAPFISLLELTYGNRELKLYSENSICTNNDKYPNTITLGENIIFVGTVNMDETTKDLSDRLLDRANIITPKKKSFLQYKREQEKIEKYNYGLKDYSLYTYYESWKYNGEAIECFTEEMLGFLDELHELIQSYDDQKGISFRTLESMGRYIKNIPLDNNCIPLISLDDAIDIQIKQKILTKIRGTRLQFGGLIGDIEQSQQFPVDSELYNMLNKAVESRISSFKSTKLEVCKKARELNLYGYTN